MLARPNTVTNRMMANADEKPVRHFSKASRLSVIEASSVVDDDRPRCEADRAEHLERRRVNAGCERDRVVEQADLRLEQEFPEITDHGRRQHHRNENNRGPEAVSPETSIDQTGQGEADQR